MKKIIFYVLILLCFNCYSDQKTFQGEIYGLITDDKSIFTIILNNGCETLQRIYPNHQETSPLPRYKSFHRYYQIIKNKIIFLSDNDIFIYNTDLMLIKKLKLPEQDPDNYSFNFSLTMLNKYSENFVILIESRDRLFILKDNELTESLNELEFLGNKLDFKNNTLAINGNPISMKFIPARMKSNKFSFAMHFLFVLNKELFLIRNCLYENSGRLLATLPFTFGVDDAVIIEDEYILINPENIVIINKKGGIIKVIDEGDPYILGNLNKDQILLQLDKHYLGLLSLKTFDLKKIDLGEKISSAVLLDNKLFYVQKDNYKILKIIPIKDIFKE